MAKGKNNKNNVSLGKPMVAGVIYRAPAGTKVPTDATTPLSDDFTSLGFVAEDGITNATDTDTTEVKEMGGGTVVKEISSYGETYQFVLLETNGETLKVRYGDGNVTVDGDKIKVKHTAPSADPHVYVLEIVLTGRRVKRIVIADGTLSEAGDITYSASDAIGYDVTISANPSDQIEDGSSMEYIATIAASAPATKSAKN
ncbi:hypothetical protein CRD60_00920 [Bifidobacterium aemilianum]|uniref:Phage tail protein n=1 Tax=Bifidobacterium aemilianum TaxID=2493120 RepID=A0A366KA35_9BIFI|nr:hypothetical protein [Bifidobacterium aemilianum]RBP98459.1 hypothetical protein CRD60_00920 [Bifidobacterium aemilianum]